jgi:hypothetical protein
MHDGDKAKQSRGQKPTVPKRSAERTPQKPAPEKQTLLRSPEKGDSLSSASQVVITESEYRALVAQKAYEIFMQRCALTEVDDWVQAERIVKETLLAQGQTAGFV